MNSTKSWEEEMDKMLAGFERQAKESLAKMKVSARRDGLEFNPEFEKYFLVASNNRIEETYKRFKINLLNEHISGGLEVNKSNVVADPIRTKNFELNPIIQIDDSSDDEGPAGLSDGFSTGNQASGNSHIVNQSTSANASVLKCRSFVIKLDRLKPDAIEYYSRGKDGVKGEHDIKPKKKDMEDDIPMIAVEPHRRIGPTIELHMNCSTKIGHDNMTNKSFSTGQNVSQNVAEMSGENTVREQSKPKKRFNCTICEYSCNYKGHFKNHMQTHSAEKRYGCDRCGKRFTRGCSLKRHTVIHEFPFY